MAYSETLDYTAGNQLRADEDGASPWPGYATPALAAAGGTLPDNVTTSPAMLAYASRIIITGNYDLIQPHARWDFTAATRQGGRWTKGDIKFKAKYVKSVTGSQSNMAVVCTTSEYDLGSTPIATDWVAPGDFPEIGRTGTLTTGFVEYTIPLTQQALDFFNAAFEAATSKGVVFHNSLGWDEDYGTMAANEYLYAEFDLTYGFKLTLESDTGLGVTLGASF